MPGLVPKCPGQSTQYWKPEDIFEISCPYCRKPVEFFKTDIKQVCPNCKNQIINPKNDLSCAKWCRYANECMGIMEK